MIRKIVSGGQSGVDRAALDAAMAHGLEHGGWCPRGRIAEDGVIPGRYRLRETGAPDYAMRTECNVMDSDGTLVLNTGALEGGTSLTVDLAEERCKPLLILDLDAIADPRTVLHWVEAHGIRVLNVAGPRESKRPGIYHRAFTVLSGILAESAAR